MTALENIVVGLDEGRLADGAVVTALHVSRLVGAPMHIVHAIKPPPGRPWLAPEEAEQWFRNEDANQVRRDRSSHVFDLLKPFATTHQEVESMLRVETGRPGHVLSAFAADHRGSMMVLGGHRHRGLLDFGGTARDILGQPLCPMSVQNAQPWSEIRRILVAVDLSPGSGPVLAHAVDLATASGAKLTIMHSFEAPMAQYDGFAQLAPATEEFRARERDAFNSFLAQHFSDGPAPDSIFEDGDPADAVAKLQEDYDLIVMGTHGQSALRRALIGSHAYRVLHQATVPVLIVPQPAL